eukprot:UN05145
MSRKRRFVDTDFYEDIPIPRKRRRINRNHNNNFAVGNDVLRLINGVTTCVTGIDYKNGMDEIMEQYCTLKSYSTIIYTV